MKSLDDQLAAEILEHIGRAELIDDVQAVYDDIDRLVSGGDSSCRACGSCCNFERFGHRLFVTTPEIVHFLSALRKGTVNCEQAAAAIAASAGRFEGRFCPLQAGSQCTARRARPAGCRMFFCCASDIEKTRRDYETAHRRLAGLCETHSVPYAYVEWTQTLRIISTMSL